MSPRFPCELDLSPVQLTPEELAQIRDSGHVRPSGDPWWEQASAPVLEYIRSKQNGVTLKRLRAWSARAGVLPWRITEESVYWLNLRELVTIQSLKGLIFIRATGRSMRVTLVASASP